MREDWEDAPGLPARLAFGQEGHLTVVAAWWGPEGAELRVVRWELRGAARALYHWARGQSAPTLGEDEADDAAADTWIAGVALEQRASPTARWDTLRRQETDGPNLARPGPPPARLGGRLARPRRADHAPLTSPQGCGTAIAFIGGRSGSTLVMEQPIDNKAKR